MHTSIKILTFIFLSTISLIAVSQNDSLPKENPFKNKFYTGGGFGLQIGNVTFIGVSPILGYNVTQNFSVGIGANYQYTDYRQYDFSVNTYGGSVFGRYTIWRSIFAHAEFEMLKMQYPELINNQINKKWMNVSSLFAGGGVRQMIGENSSLVLLVLWNFNETPYSPYSNPVFRIGFEIGL